MKKSGFCDFDATVSTTRVIDSNFNRSHSPPDNADFAMKCVSGFQNFQRFFILSVSMKFGYYQIIHSVDGNSFRYL